MDSWNYSVLMSVYYREKPNQLKDAMNSIWNQTIPAQEFVLVCDGPLTQELDSVVETMQQEHLNLKVVRLEKNSGLGTALNIGIKNCTNELVARMDSDDISREDRCEKQLRVFQNDPSISVCSGIVEEFSSDKDEEPIMRIPPESQTEIKEYAKKRNPFNHPCVMYRKKDVEEAGGYQDFYLLEDYYLWIRMLQKGFIGYNLQEPLLWMRAGAGMYKRRSGWKYAKSQKALFKYMLKCRMITPNEYRKSVFVRVVSSIMPNCLRQFLFKRMLRGKNAYN